MQKKDGTSDCRVEKETMKVLEMSDRDKSELNSKKNTSISRLKPLRNR